jgi:hypothetical protein
MTKKLEFEGDLNISEEEGGFVPFHINLGNYCSDNLGVLITRAFGDYDEDGRGFSLNMKHDGTVNYGKAKVTIELFDL